MNRSTFFKMHALQSSCDDLIQHATQISRNALASGLSDICRNRGLAPSG